MIAENAKKCQDQDALRESRIDDGLSFDEIPGDGRLPLYVQYSGQSMPQAAYLELFASGRVCVGINGEIGNAIPADVWHGERLRWTIPNDLSILGISELGEHFRPLLARVHAGHTVQWDGSNFTGRLSADAQAASDSMEYELANLDPDDFDRDELPDEDEGEHTAEAAEKLSSLQELTGQESGEVSVLAPEGWN